MAEQNHLDLHAQLEFRESRQKNRYILMYHSVSSEYKVVNNIIAPVWIRGVEPVKGRLFKVCKVKKMGHGGRPQIRKRIHF